MKQTFNFLIIEDHDIVATALELIILNLYSTAVVNKVSSFPKGVKLIESGEKVDLVILDMDTPGSQSYSMVATLRNAQPSIRILIFTGHNEQRHAPRFLSVGANGFLSKDSPKEDLTVAIRTVMQDRKYLSPAMQDFVAMNYFGKATTEKDITNNPLSLRETEVLGLLLEGKWTKEIAAELNLKLTTVSTHKARIFQKLDVTNVLELFKKLKPE